MKTGDRAFTGPQPRGGNLGMPKNLDRLYRRYHRPFDGPRTGLTMGASDGVCGRDQFRPPMAFLVGRFKS